MSHTLDSLRHSMAWRKHNRSLYGHMLPSHVVWVEVHQDALNEADIVRWINEDGSKHRCPLNYPPTRDGVNAVIVAMKLSQ